MRWGGGSGQRSSVTSGGEGRKLVGNFDKRPVRIVSKVGLVVALL